MHRITGSGRLVRSLLVLLAGVIAPLAFASGALAAPSVAINSFTYNPSDSTHQALIVKATNTGANPLTTFAIQLARNGTARTAVLTVGSKSYSSYCQAENGGNTFPAIQCNIPSGVVPAQTAFTVTFAMSPGISRKSDQHLVRGRQDRRQRSKFHRPDPRREFAAAATATATATAPVTAGASEAVLGDHGLSGGAVEWSCRPAVLADDHRVRRDGSLHVRTGFRQCPARHVDGYRRGVLGHPHPTRHLRIRRQGNRCKRLLCNQELLGRHHAKPPRRPALAPG